MKNKETMKEMFDRFMADPNIMESEMIKKSQKFGAALDRLTQEIVQPCLEYSQESGKEDEGWSNTILIALARATCKLIYSLQKSTDHPANDIFEHYMEMLPLCKEIAYRECDQAVEQAAEEEEDGIPYETKKGLVLAIANPDVTPEEIVERYMKKDITEEKRQEVIKFIVETRQKHADLLKGTHELFRKIDDQEAS